MPKHNVSRVVADETALEALLGEITVIMKGCFRLNPGGKIGRFDGTITSSSEVRIVHRRATVTIDGCHGLLKVARRV